MSISYAFVYEGDLDGLKLLERQKLHFKCECGDELMAGGQLTERSKMVRDWKENHRGKGHGFVKLAS